MASPPEARNSAQGAVYGQLLQVRDIHGGVTLNAPPPVPGPAADVSLDPPRPATTVRGREGLLAALRTAMEHGAPVPHVLTGPGGFGKTTVAAALAEHARSQRWTVFWIRPDTILPSMLEVAVELGGSREEADQFKAAPRQAARWVWRHLDAAPRPWLLVIDNADQPELLDPENRPGEQRGWMRSSPGGFVLVTSRVDDPALWAPAQVHRVEVLESADAAVTLADHAGLPELSGATELAERLGGVPLALSLTGRILATHRVLFPDAHALLAHLENDIRGLDELSAPLVTGADSERQLLSGVWDLSLRLAAEREPHSAPLLRLLSVLGCNSAAVPLRRLPLTELAHRELASLDEAGMARAVNALIVHGLVTVGRQDGETSLQLHPLVSETIRAGLGPGSAPLLETARQLLARDADRDLALELGAFTALYGVHRRLHGNMHPDSVLTQVRAQRAIMLLGEAEAAEATLRGVVDQSRSELGADHPEHLRARHALADAVRSLGRIEEAGELYLATADRRASVLGPEHPDTLSSRHQVALMTLLLGDLDAAEEGFLAIAEAGVREPGSIALQASENLAHVNLRRGRADLAEERFRGILRTRSHGQGDEHPGTLATAFSLAQALRAQERREEAAEVFARVAQGRAKVLGEEHPLTVASREAREEALGQPG